MTDRPILFSAPMVRAILSGRKSQTRRAVKPAEWNFAPRPEFNIDTATGRHEWLARKAGEPSTFRWLPCPHGQPGDRLWVRESHWFFQDEADPVTGYTPPVLTVDDVEYRADGESTRHRWRPSIHMPRWASRITLEITGVRVERLNAISEDDTRAEGITDGGCLNCGNSELSCGCLNPRPDARDAFVSLWSSINGRESWDANPWVWVVEFKRLEA